MANDFENEVGYQKPPKTTQFLKGRSGNPSGRPRKNPGIAEVFRKVSKEVVSTTGQHGERRSMTKMEATVTQLVNKAATGDLKAMKVLFQIASRYPELVKDPDASITLVITPVQPKTSNGNH